jgi:hypothetical protein
MYVHALMYNIQVDMGNHLECIYFEDRLSSEFLFVLIYS